MNTIYEDAIEFFGETNQKKKAIEECSELITAILHHSDQKVSERDLAAEIADVEIMCQQLRYMIGPDLVDKEMQNKLNRLAARISDGG